MPLQVLQNLERSTEAGAATFVRSKESLRSMMRRSVHVEIKSFAALLCLKNALVKPLMLSSNSTMRLYAGQELKPNKCCLQECQRTGMTSKKLAYQTASKLWRMTHLS